MTSITHRDHSEDSRELKQRLIEQGWTWLAGGCYADVFTHPNCPDTVLKVGRDVNDAWLDYAQNRPDSPHAPRIEMIEINSDHYFAEIELLEPLPIDDYKQLGLASKPYLWEIQDPSLDHFLHDVDALRNGHCADYHDGNFMRRPSTGEIVCIDPWS